MLLVFNYAKWSFNDILYMNTSCLFQVNIIDNSEKLILRKLLGCIKKALESLCRTCLGFVSWIKEKDPLRLQVAKYDIYKYQINNCDRAYQKIILEQLRGKQTFNVKV